MINKTVVMSDDLKFEVSKFQANVTKEYQIWRQHYPEIKKKFSPILTTQAKHLMELNQVVDIGGYNSFILDIARRTFYKSISDNIVSVQPMTAPTSKVFYYDPEITTGSSHTAFTKMHSSDYHNLIYDQSKGVQSLITGTSISLNGNQLTGGTEVIFPYSGGMEGLTSLQLWEETVGSTISGTNIAYSGNGGFISQSSTPAGTTVINAASLAFDNDLGTNAFWFNGSNLTSVSLTRELSAATIINRYRITPGAANLAAAPSAWVLSGVTGVGGTWTLIDSGTKSDWNGTTNLWYDKTFANTQPYLSYRLIVTGFTSPITLSLTEVQFFNETTTVGGFNELDFTISPQTWSVDIDSGNTISVITSGSSTGSSYFSTWKEYETLEDKSEIQEIKLTLTSGDIYANQTRKLVTKWSDELEQDLEAYFNLSMESEMADLLSSEIAVEIDREIISDLIRIAAYRAEWHYDMYSLSSVTGVFFSGDQREITGVDLSGITLDQWAKDSLYTKIQQLSGVLKKENFYHQANWIICSSYVGAIIESMREFYPQNTVGSYQILKIGKLTGQYTVYVDPNLPQNVLLMGYKGYDLFDAGYIYAPYILSDLRDAIDADTLFLKTKNVMSRYGTKIIDNRNFAMIDCIFPSDYNPTTNNT